MAQWNPNKNPNEYPLAWHRYLMQGEGLYIMLQGVGHTVGNRERKKFNAFKASLRKHPLHETSRALSKLTTRISLEPDVAGGLMVVLRVKKKDDKAINAVAKVL